MATRATRLIVNLETGLLMPSTDGVAGATNPRFVLGDNVPIEIYLVQPSQSGAIPYFTIPFPAGSTVKAAIGSINKNPTDGQWFLSYDGDETEALDAEATATQVQTALNALASITAAGGVVVSKIGTQFNITFNNVGDRLEFISRDESLFPASVIQQQVLQEGSGSAAEVVLVNLAVRPIAYTDSFTSIDAPAGSYTANTFELSGNFKAGTFRLQLTWSDTESHTVWTDPIALNDSPTVISQKIFDALTFNGWGRDLVFARNAQRTTNNWGLSITNTNPNKWRADFVAPVYTNPEGDIENAYKGNFRISYNGDETFDLPWNASAATVQSALNALTSVTDEGGLTVGKDEGKLKRSAYQNASDPPTYPYNQQFIITWNQPGDRTAFTVRSLSLYPTTNPLVEVSQNGTVELAEVATIALNTFASEPTVTGPEIVGIDITDLPALPGQKASLNLATAEAIAYLGTATSANATIEIQLEAGEEIQTICQTNCLIQGQVIADGAFAPQTLANALDETVANARFVRRDLEQSPTTGEQDYIWKNLGVNNGEGAGNQIAAALSTANTPSSSNSFATLADLTGGYDQSLNTTDSVTFAGLNVSTSGIALSTGSLAVQGSGADSYYTHDLITMQGVNVLTPSTLSLTGLLGSLTIDGDSGITFPDTTIQETRVVREAQATTATAINQTQYPSEVKVIDNTGTAYWIPARLA